MTKANQKPIILAEQVQTSLTNLEPLTRKVYISLNPPSPQDNRAIVDQFRHRMEHSYGSVHVPLTLMSLISGICTRAGWQVTATLAETGQGWTVIDLEPGNTAQQHYGLAIDIGTTTVVVYLIDLCNGKVLKHAADYNDQVFMGEDILTRIRYSSEPGGLDSLQSAVLKTLNRLIKRLYPLPAETSKITAAAIGANTTMIHLLLGLDPSSICRAPYTPIVNNPGIIHAQEIGLDIHPLAPIYCLPSIGSYLGGDVIGGILVSGMHRQPDVSLFVDIGTNGEIVLGNEEWLVACAGAAGPALEGGVSAHGMRAEPGAVDHVSINPVTGCVEYSTVGNLPARGICGSGLVDTLAELFVGGIINRSAHFQNGQKEFIVVPAHEAATGEDIVITQADINKFMATKGAVNAATDLLMENVGCDWREISHFYAAGAFGQYLPVESAVTIGLYPDLPRTAILRLGNSSGEAARQVLLSRTKRLEAEEIAGKVTYFELNANSAFMDKFVSSKFLPHTDLDRYPSVKKRLQTGSKFSCVI
ncbi:putative metal-binding protein [Desulfosporosinus orientis DSM 765]|uniref:Putative metal-binding protein n=1 Tax=Desulfosporosinus orientis (strain ATCC 19365 / DSM 765 / NCIMB 8382 / VKM B-1628 / Singapore I) TaxID=768706 RepID=G7WAE1_DESOD|nr:ASKHA domain-containing protein [Desulfosporosinus orientis]AET66490.1 putative metal-binding protein [Desulfosporosinus orientis DSM 765]